MYGESQKENDLFFTCSLIEYIARKTKNTKKAIVEQIGEKNLQKIYELASIYHTENIDKIATEIIEKSHITLGQYNPLVNCKYRIPTYFELGKIYKRLIIMVNPEEKHYIKTLIEVLSSWMIPHIDNYNSSMFYENPDYIYECYKEGKIL